jgi:hypothetical protein
MAASAPHTHGRATGGGFAANFAARVAALRDPPSCASARLLISTPSRADGFASALHDVGKAMVLAQGSGRSLVLTGQWRYAPCAAKVWDCVFIPPSRCNLSHAEEAPPALAQPAAPALFWDDTPAGSSPGFFQLLMGSQRVVHEDALYDDRNETRRVREVINAVLTSSALTAEFLEAGGNFWVRSQAQLHLWRLTPERASALARNPVYDDFLRVQAAGHKVIGLHMRLTANVGTIRRDFKFNATRRFAVTEFLAMARRIRARHPSATALFVATDSLEAVEAVSSATAADGWRLLMQQGAKVERASGHEWLWFKRPTAGTAVDGVVADLECLRRADFLVGSMISNVYRLAAELNFASRPARPAHQTIYSMDVPWYQHP